MKKRVMLCFILFSPSMWGMEKSLPIQISSEVKDKRSSQTYPKFSPKEGEVSPEFSKKVKRVDSPCIQRTQSNPQFYVVQLTSQEQEEEVARRMLRSKSTGSPAAERFKKEVFEKEQILKATEEAERGLCCLVLPLAVLSVITEEKK